MVFLALLSTFTEPYDVRCMCEEVFAESSQLNGFEFLWENSVKNMHCMLCPPLPSF